MKKYSPLLLPVLGLIGYLLAFSLFNHTAPAASWRHRLPRHEAIAKAREIASKFGADTANWNAIVRADYNRPIDIYQKANPRAAWASLLTPTTLEIWLIDYASGRSIQVKLNADGVLLEVFRRNNTGGGRPPRDPGAATQSTPPKTTMAQDKQTAEEKLPLLLGSFRGEFSLLPTTAENQRRREFTWLAGDDRLKLAAEIALRDGEITDLAIRHSPTAQFRAELEAMRPGALKFISNSENLIFAPAIIGVIILYFIGIARRQINHRETLRMLLFSFLFFLVINLLGAFFDGLRFNFRISLPQNMPRLEQILFWVVFVLVNALMAAGLYFFQATGSSLPVEGARRRSVDLELLLKGRLRARPVAESIFYGMFAGGLLAMLPFLVAASGLDSSVMLDSHGLYHSLAARFPAVVSFFSAWQYFVLLIFTFLIPLIQAYVKRGLAANLLIFATVWMTISGNDFVHIGLASAIILNTLLTFFLLWLYRTYGLLAIATSMMGWQAAITAASLLAQPSSVIQGSGWRTLAGLVTALSGASILVWKARDLRADEIALTSRQTETRAERERLRAEFDVARRAQQHMLPDAPPIVPGYNIAAVCCPSKEVGGDLYDFLPLPGGKWGIVVADVSGKGVPASLYMTLTKGLLESVSENKTDPGEILRDVNRHLFDVCRRKMFVTLFLGVLDPQHKTLSYARAGHNPTVLRSPSNQATSLLKSRGMGLGLNNGKLFDGSLRVETITLNSRDKLYFYSDGITEAMNLKNEEYGEDRLMAIAAKADDLNADDARDAVMADVKRFLGEMVPQDDQTLVVLEVR